MINATDMFSVFFLVFLEGVLSLDNALVLALMVKHLPPAQQKKALTYGIWGAFAFRFISLFFLTHLMGINWIKWAGGGYLVFLAMKHFIWGESDSKTSAYGAFSLWRTICLVELMDIAFSIDSILAAVSLSQNFFIVLAGGILGICMMRFSARAFLWLIDRFPRMETTAYGLVLVIGLKLVVQGFDFPWADFHDSKNACAWLFWLLMMSVLGMGFTGKKCPLAQYVTGAK